MSRPVRRSARRTSNPHGEGNANPIELYEPTLSTIDPNLRAAFLGENMADCFARIGDPLPEITSKH